jgi:hypothetical protein
MELARGRDLDALAAFRAAERLARHLDTPHLAVPPTRAMRLIILVRLGEIDPANIFWPDLTTRTASMATSASPRRRCGWPSMTRARRLLRWRRF